MVEAGRGIPRYLVTGGAGFIGSHLVRRLLNQGVEVRVLDDFSTGRHANLEEVASRIELVEGSLSDPSAVRRAVAGVEVVFHQAAIPSVPRSILAPEETHAANATGTLVLLQASLEARVRRLVYASSSSVYGANETLPKRESMIPEPLSPYAVSKLAGEQYCLVYHRLHGLETVALRYFNVFGPRQDPSSPYSGVVSCFLSALASARAPVIHGDGEQSRDFTYVDNVVDANWAAAHRSGVAGRVYNIGCSTRTSINQLWEVVAREAGSSLTPVHEPTRPGDVRHSLADISRARAELDFQPRVSLAEGLRRTLEYYELLAPRTEGPARTK
jgi:UDP-glucose 4-epimerase